MQQAGWTPTPSEIRYAEWFAWSQHVLGFPDPLAHEAARAAVAADPAGLDPQRAQDAARYVRPGESTPPGPPISTFSEWYAWARNSRGFDAQTAQRMAVSATVAALRGATRNQTMAAAMTEVHFDPSAPRGYSAREEASRTSWLKRGGMGMFVAIFAVPVVGLLLTLIPYTAAGAVSGPTALIFSFYRLANPQRHPHQLVLVGMGISLIACVIVIVRVTNIGGY